MLLRYPKRRQPNGRWRAYSSLTMFTPLRALPRRTVATAVVCAAGAWATGVAGVGVAAAHARSSAHTPGVTRETTVTPVACGSGTYEAPSDWYLPAGTPKGLVWAQHGFFEDKGMWTQFATELARSGDVVLATTLPTFDLHGCTVENLGFNPPFLTAIASWFAGAGNPHGVLARSFAAATAAAGRPDLVLPKRFAFIGHSAGGEAVLYVAKQLAALSPSAFAELGGLVLADPVASFIGDNTPSALTMLATTDLPVYAIATPPSSCNANQSGTAAVQQILRSRPFVGVQVNTGSHPDIFGSSANILEKLVCGFPRRQNVSATQTLAAGWLGDELAGTTTPALYPGGSTYDALVKQVVISTLP